jgi:hypothetical protein
MGVMFFSEILQLGRTLMLFDELVKMEILHRFIQCCATRCLWLNHLMVPCIFSFLVAKHHMPRGRCDIEQRTFFIKFRKIFKKV